MADLAHADAQPALLVEQQGEDEQGQGHQQRSVAQVAGQDIAHLAPVLHASQPGSCGAGLLQRGRAREVRAADPQHALADVAGVLVDLPDQLLLGVVQADQQLEVALVVADQRVQVVPLRLEQLADRHLPVLAPGLAGVYLQRAQHPLHLALQRGQLAPAVLLLERLQLHVADQRLPGADQALVLALVGQGRLLLAQEQPDRVGQPHRVDSFLRARELLLQLVEGLLGPLELVGGLLDPGDQLLRLLGQPAVLLGQRPQQRVGFGGLDAGALRAQRRVRLKPLLQGLLPALDLLLQLGQLGRGQVPLHRQHVRGRLVGRNLVLQPLQLLLDRLAPRQPLRLLCQIGQGEAAVLDQRHQLPVRLVQLRGSRRQLVGDVVPTRGATLGLRLQPGELLLGLGPLVLLLREDLFQFRARGVLRRLGLRGRGQGLQGQSHLLQTLRRGAGGLRKLRGMLRPLRRLGQVRQRLFVGLADLRPGRLVQIGGAVQLLEPGLDLLAGDLPRRRLGHRRHLCPRARRRKRGPNDCRPRQHAGCVSRAAEARLPLPVGLAWRC